MACADKNECLHPLDNDCAESGKICFSTVGSFGCRALTPTTPLWDGVLTVSGGNAIPITTTETTDTITVPNDKLCEIISMKVNIDITHLDVFDLKLLLGGESSQISAYLSIFKTVMVLTLP